MSYPIRLSKSNVDAMAWLREQPGMTAHRKQIAEYTGVHDTAVYGTFSTLQHWQFIEQHSAKHWTLTSRGCDFLDGVLKVRRGFDIHHNEIVDAHPDMCWLEDIVGEDGHPAPARFPWEDDDQTWHRPQE
jgi:hypothetical protein